MLIGNDEATSDGAGHLGLVAVRHMRLNHGVLDLGTRAVLGQFLPRIAPVVGVAQSHSSALSHSTSHQLHCHVGGTDAVAVVVVIPALGDLHIHSFGDQFVGDGERVTIRRSSDRRLFIVIHPSFFHRIGDLLAAFVHGHVFPFNRSLAQFDGLLAHLGLGDVFRFLIQRHGHIDTLAILVVVVIPHLGSSHVNGVHLMGVGDGDHAIFNHRACLGVACRYFNFIHRPNDGIDAVVVLGQILEGMAPSILVASLQSSQRSSLVDIAVLLQLHSNVAGTDAILIAAIGPHLRHSHFRGFGGVGVGQGSHGARLAGVGQTVAFGHGAFRPGVRNFLASSLQGQIPNGSSPAISLIKSYGRNSSRTVGQGNLQLGRTLAILILSVSPHLLHGSFRGVGSMLVGHAQAVSGVSRLIITVGSRYFLNSPHDRTVLIAVIHGQTADFFSPLVTFAGECKLLTIRLAIRIQQQLNRSRTDAILIAVVVPDLLHGHFRGGRGMAVLDNEAFCNTTRNRLGVVSRHRKLIHGVVDGLASSLQGQFAPSLAPAIRLAQRNSLALGLTIGIQLHLNRRGTNAILVILVIPRLGYGHAGLARRVLIGNCRHSAFGRVALQAVACRHSFRPSVGDLLTHSTRTILGQILNGSSPVVGFVQLHLGTVGEGDLQFSRTNVILVVAVFPDLLHGSGSRFRLMLVGDGEIPTIGTAALGHTGLRNVSSIARHSLFINGILDERAVRICIQAFPVNLPTVCSSQHFRLSRGAICLQVNGNAFGALTILVVVVFPFLLKADIDLLDIMGVGQGGHGAILAGVVQLVSAHGAFRPGIHDCLAIGILGQIINDSSPAVGSIQRHFRAVRQGDLQLRGTLAILVVVVGPHLLHGSFRSLGVMRVGYGEASISVAGNAGGVVSHRIFSHAVGDRHTVLVLGQFGPGHGQSIAGCTLSDDLLLAFDNHSRSILAYLLGQTQGRIGALAILVVVVVPYLGGGDGHQLLRVCVFDGHFSFTVCGDGSNSIVTGNSQIIANNFSTRFGHSICTGYQTADGDFIIGQISIGNLAFIASGTSHGKFNTVDIQAFRLVFEALDDLQAAGHQAVGYSQTIFRDALFITRHSDFINGVLDGFTFFVLIQTGEGVAEGILGSNIQGDTGNFRLAVAFALHQHQDDGRGTRTGAVVIIVPLLGHGDLGLFGNASILDDITGFGAAFDGGFVAFRLHFLQGVLNKPIHVFGGKLQFVGPVVTIGEDERIAVGFVVSVNLHADFVRTQAVGIVAVVPHLGDLHIELGNIAIGISEVKAALGGTIAVHLIFGHGVNVLMAILIIDGQVGIGIVIHVPGFGNIQFDLFAAVHRTVQTNIQFLGVDVGNAVVTHPVLGTGQIHAGLLPDAHIFDVGTDGAVSCGLLVLEAVAGSNQRVGFGVPAFEYVVIAFHVPVGGLVGNIFLLEVVPGAGQRIGSFNKRLIRIGEVFIVFVLIGSLVNQVVVQAQLQRIIFLHNTSGDCIGMILIQLVAGNVLAIGRNSLPSNAFAGFTEVFPLHIFAILLLEEMLHDILILRRIGRSELGHIFGIHVPAIGNGAVLADIEVSVNQIGGQGSIGGNQGITLIPAQEDVVADGLSSRTQHRLAGFAIGLIQGTSNSTKCFVIAYIGHVDGGVSVVLDIGVNHVEGLARLHLHLVLVRIEVAIFTLRTIITRRIKGLESPDVADSICRQGLHSMRLTHVIIEYMHVVGVVHLHIIHIVFDVVPHGLVAFVQKFQTGLVTLEQTGNNKGHALLIGVIQGFNLALCHAVGLKFLITIQPQSEAGMLIISNGIQRFMIGLIGIKFRKAPQVKGDGFTKVNSFFKGGVLGHGFPLIGVEELIVERIQVALVIDDLGLLISGSQLVAIDNGSAGRRQIVFVKAIQGIVTRQQILLGIGLVTVVLITIAIAAGTGNGLGSTLQFCPGANLIINRPDISLVAGQHLITIGEITGLAGFVFLIAGVGIAAVGQGIHGIIVEVDIHRAVVAVHGHLCSIEGDGAVLLIDHSIFHAGDADGLVGTVIHDTFIGTLRNHISGVVGLEDNSLGFVESFAIAVDVVVVHVHRDLHLGRTPNSGEGGVFIQSHLFAGTVETGLRFGIGGLAGRRPAIECQIDITIGHGEASTAGHGDFIASGYSHGLNGIVSIDESSSRGIPPHGIDGGILPDHHFGVRQIHGGGIRRGTPALEQLVFGRGNAIDGSQVHLETGVISLAFGNGTGATVKIVAQSDLRTPNGKVFGILTQGDFGASSQDVFRISIFGTSGFAPAKEALAFGSSEAVLTEQGVLGVGLSLSAFNSTLTLVSIKGDLYFGTPDGIIGLVAVLARHLIAGSIIGAVQIIGIIGLAPAVEYLAFRSGEASGGHGEVGSVSSHNFIGAVVAHEGYIAGLVGNHDVDAVFAQIAATLRAAVIVHSLTGAFLFTLESDGSQLHAAVAGHGFIGRSNFSNNEFLGIFLPGVIVAIIPQGDILTHLYIVGTTVGNKGAFRLLLPHSIEGGNNFAIKAHGVGSTGRHNASRHGSAPSQIGHGSGGPANQHKAILGQARSGRQGDGLAFLGVDGVHGAISAVQIKGHGDISRILLPHGIQSHFASTRFANGIIAIDIGRNSFRFAQIGYFGFAPTQESITVAGEAHGNVDGIRSASVHGLGGIALEVGKHNLHLGRQNLPGGGDGGIAADGGSITSSVHRAVHIPASEFITFGSREGAGGQLIAFTGSHASHFTGAFAGREGDVIGRSGCFDNVKSNYRTIIPSALFVINRTIPQCVITHITSRESKRPCFIARLETIVHICF